MRLNCKHTQQFLFLNFTTTLPTVNATPKNSSTPQSASLRDFIEIIRVLVVLLISVINNYVENIFASIVST